MAQKRQLTIHFTDSTKISFEFPQQLTNTLTMAQKISDILKGENLVIEADGVLLLIPLNNVKYIQSTPAPEKLPETVIKGATIISGG